MKKLINVHTYMHYWFTPRKHNSRLKVLNAIGNVAKNADFMTTAMYFGNSFFTPEMIF